MAHNRKEQDAENAALSLIFGAIAALSVIGLLLSRRNRIHVGPDRARYMPPTLTIGPSLNSHGRVIPGKVFPGGIAYVQMTLLQPIGDPHDSGVVFPQYTYETAGAPHNPSLTPHAFSKGQPDYNVYTIPTAGNWENLVVSGVGIEKFNNLPRFVEPFSQQIF